MKLGFGSYRVSTSQPEHKEALIAALNEGCSLIDTSSNYTDGQSEVIVGEVLKQTKAKPTIVTKAGYVQGQNLLAFNKLKEKSELDFVDFGDGLLHSIDPVFLDHQINQSLERMKLESIDVFLLHNPEYFLKKNPGQKSQYYQKIEKAFTFLNSKVSEGIIKEFGISSNTFVDPREEDTATDFEEVWKIAERVGALDSFKWIQFPMNLIETGALEKQFQGQNLIEKAKSLGIKTIANRPLNAFSSSGLLRLATYKVDSSLLGDANDLFEEKIKTLRDQWGADAEHEDDKLEDVPLFFQIKNIWSQQQSQDAVQQIFFGHFFPFVARVFGKDLTPAQSQPFYDLYDSAMEFAKKNMNERANTFMTQAESAGLIEPGVGTVSQRALRKYAQTDVDYVLVGMRKLEYVEDLKEFF